MITELAQADVPRAASLFAAFTHDRARLECYLAVGDARSVTGDTRIFVDDPASPAVAMLLSPDAEIDRISSRRRARWAPWL